MYYSPSLQGCMLLKQLARPKIHLYWSKMSDATEQWHLRAANSNNPVVFFGTLHLIMHDGDFLYCWSDHANPPFVSHRCFNSWRSRWQNQDGTLCRCLSQNSRKLSPVLHWRIYVRPYATTVVCVSVPATVPPSCVGFLTLHWLIVVYLYLQEKWIPCRIQKLSIP